MTKFKISQENGWRSDPGVKTNTGYHGSVFLVSLCCFHKPLVNNEPMKCFVLQTMAEEDRRHTTTLQYSPSLQTFTVSTAPRTGAFVSLSSHVVVKKEAECGHCNVQSYLKVPGFLLIRGLQMGPWPLCHPGAQWGLVVLETLVSL